MLKAKQIPCIEVLRGRGTAAKLGDTEMSAICPI